MNQEQKRQAEAIRNTAQRAMDGVISFDLFTSFISMFAKTLNQDRKERDEIHRRDAAA